jgi:hypothetical protein
MTMVRNKGGRPAFEPTEEQRKNVDIMVGLGIPQEHICAMVRDHRDRPISHVTLRKYFRKEIEQASARLNAQMGNFIVATALGLPPPPGIKPITDEKVRASFAELFAAARMDWRKTVRTEHANATGPDGKPVAFIYQANKTDSKL